MSELILPSADAPRTPPALHFWTRGRGEPLVLIHGFMVSGQMFEPVAQYLESQYELIIPDLRGYGGSKELPGPYTIAQLGHDIIELLDYLGYTRVHLLGFSKGGLVAQWLALEYPERFNSLVLAGTFPYKATSALERLQRSLAAEALERVGTQGVGRLLGAYISLGGDALNRKQLLSVRNMIHHNNQKAVMKYLEEIFNQDFRPKLPQIEHNTLLLAGQQDLLVPPHHQHTFLQSLPKARLRMLPDAGHAMFYTHTKEVGTGLRDFLDRQQNALSTELNPAPGAA